MLGDWHSTVEHFSSYITKMLTESVKFAFDLERKFTSMSKNDHAGGISGKVYSVQYG